MSPKNTTIPAPDCLQKAGKRFWKQVLDVYQLEDAHHLRLLENAAICLDRASAAREAIARDGITTVNSRGEVKEHPSVGTERQAFQVFRTTVRELGLDLDLPDIRGPRRPGSRQ